METRKQYSRLGLALLIALALTAVPLLLALRVVPLLQGPDEHLHLKNIFFRYVRPYQLVRVQEGLSSPGLAPNGQAHQAPLYYWSMARVLDVVLNKADVGSFFDYEAGFKGIEQKAGYPFQQAAPNEARGEQIETSIYLLRALNVASFFAVLALAYTLGVQAFPRQPELAYAAMIFAAAIPAALWRTIFVSNDNALVLFASLTFAICIEPVLKGFGFSTRRIVLVAALSAASFLAKYSGIAVLAITLLCIFFTPESAKKRAGKLALAFGVTLALILPHLLANALIDGDALLIGAIQRGYPNILQPLSWGELLLQHHFLPVLMTNFFYPFPEIDFPPFAIHLWHIWLLIAVLGTVSLLVRTCPVSLPRKVAAVSLASIAISVVVICFYGRLFPIPHGRYIHAAILPAALFITGGSYEFLRLLRFPDRTAGALTCTATLLIAVWTNFFSVHYLSHRFSGSAATKTSAIDLGAEVLPLALDPNPGDELLFLERFPTRSFVAFERDGNFFMAPDMTRVYSLPFDYFLGGNTQSGTGDDVLNFRPGIPAWFRTSSRYFREFDPAISPERDFAVRSESFGVAGAKDSIPIVADFSHDGLDDLGMFQSSTGKWFVETRADEAFRTGGVKGLQVIQMPDKKVQPHAVKLDGHVMLAAHSIRKGELRLVDLAKPLTETVLQIHPHDHLLFGDLNTDGTDEVVGWNEGSICLDIYTLAKSAEPAKQAPISLCPKNAPAPFSRHQQLVLRHKKDLCLEFCAFDKRVGDLFCFDSGMCALIPEPGTRVEVPTRSFDPGWYGAPYRSTVYRR